ncbi:MAG: HlyU family transcriptional regulator [Neptuniibacter sp.]
MSLLSSIKSIFAPLPEGAIRYKGFTIAADPEEDFGRFRMNGVISKKGRQRNFTMVDRVADRANCVKITQNKAKNLIDQKGEQIFIS